MFQTIEWNIGDRRIGAGSGWSFHYLPLLGHEGKSSSPPRVQLKIMTIPNSEITFAVLSSDMIASVKMVIQLMTGISFTNQQLHYSGNVQGVQLLDNNRTLKSYNIKSGHILSLVLYLNGCPPMAYFGPTERLYILGDEPKLLSVSTFFLLRLLN